MTEHTDTPGSDPRLLINIFRIAAVTTTMKISDLVSSVNFHVTMNPPRETGKGFCELLTVEFCDYGPQPEGEDQLTLSIRLRGRDKTSKGTPDMRTRKRGAIFSHRSEDLTLLLEAIATIEDQRIIQIRQFAEQEIEKYSELWKEMGY